jgi:sugar (pentulose or hexulose) kinase
MTSPSLILAVDAGSTTFKAAAYTEALEEMATACVPTPYSHRRDDCCQMPVESVTKAVVRLRDELMRDLNLAAADWRVAVTGQAQTFAVLGETEEERLPFISWMDVRAGLQSRWLEERIGPGFHRHCSFSRPLPELMLTKLVSAHQARRNFPGAGDRCLPLVSFVGELLTGVCVLDTNQAAMTGLYSLEHQDWWPQALELAGTTAAHLPRLVPAGVPLPATAELTPGHTVRAFVPCANDQTAGALGAGLERGRLLVTLGTALVVYRRTGTDPGPYTPEGCWGPYPGSGYYELATSDHGGKALLAARGKLMPGAPLTSVDALAVEGREALSIDAPVFFPSLADREPWKPFSRPEADLPVLCYAVLEGIAFELRLLLEHLCETIPDSLAVAGGGARSPFWRQVLADVLACRITTTEGNPVHGAAVLATKSGTPSPGKSTGPFCDPDRQWTERSRARYVHWRRRRLALDR